MGFSKKYANARWICSFLPEEINKVTNNPEIFNKKELMLNDVYSYISEIIDSIDSVNEYDQLSIQYQRHFLSNLICKSSKLKSSIDTGEDPCPLKS